MRPVCPACGPALGGHGDVADPPPAAAPHHLWRRSVDVLGDLVPGAGHSHLRQHPLLAVLAAEVPPRGRVDVEGLVAGLDQLAVPRNLATQHRVLQQAIPVVTTLNLPPHARHRRPRGSAYRCADSSPGERRHYSSWCCCCYRRGHDLAAMEILERERETKRDDGDAWTVRHIKSARPLYRHSSLSELRRLFSFICGRAFGLFAIPIPEPPRVAVVRPRSHFVLSLAPLTRPVR